MDMFEDSTMERLASFKRHLKTYLLNTHFNADFVRNVIMTLIYLSGNQHIIAVL